MNSPRQRVILNVCGDGCVMDSQTCTTRDRNELHTQYSFLEFFVNLFFFFVIISGGGGGFAAELFK